MSKRGIALAVCLAALIPAAAETGTTPASKSIESANLLVDRYYDTYFHFHPTAATVNGFHPYDSQLEDFSRANLEREAAAWRALLPEFRGARSPRLAQAMADDLEFLEGQTRGRLLELETIRMWQKDPDLYGSSPAYSIFLLMKRNFAPPTERLRSVIARERQIPALFEAARRNLENPPRVYTEIALEQLPGTIDFFRKDVPSAFSSVTDPQLLEEFRATTSAVLAAYEKYRNFLHDDLLPISRGDFRLGADTFRKKLLYDEMVDIPLDRLREIAYADLRANQQHLRQVAAQIDPKKSTVDVLADIRKDHPNGDQLIPSFRQVLSNLRQFIAQKKIMTIPSDVEPVVEETPPFARALTTAAMDTPGPYETKAKEGIFEVTLPDPKWKPEHVNDYLSGFSPGIITSTAIHEVYPGHYMQYLWSLNASSKVRKLSYCDSNSEGWAHYTEQMMLDEGYSNDPRLRIGQLVDALLRDARFIAGIEMHTGTMSIAQAKEFFVKEGYQVAPLAEVEARRGTSDPTYLVYTLGKLQILKLREDYRKQRGDQFTLLEFHDRFMAQGGLPIKVIRRAMLGNESPTL